MRQLALAFLTFATYATAQTPSQPVFRSGAEVIAIDVTVVGKDGMPVADLGAADFEVSVEGQPRAIQSAQFLRADTTPRLTRPDEASNTDPSSGRLLLIVTDQASLRLSSQTVVSAARGLLKHLGAGDLVGVTHIPEGGGVPFTTDRARVINELGRLRPRTAGFMNQKTVYLSEALDFDLSQRLQWPQAVQRECGVEADAASYRTCVVALEQEARMVLIDSSVRANEFARNLERIMKSLEPTGQPVTMVVISDKMVLARDPGALVGLAEACAEARVSLHVIHPVPPITELQTVHGFPSDPVTDRALEAEGLEQMAARTRGTYHKVVGDGAGAFEQISREISGYYLLGIEPSPEDRKQPRRRVDVKVRRPGLTVRARPMFRLDRAPALTGDPTTRLKQLLESPSLMKGLPIRMTSRAISGDNNQLRVLVVAEIGEPTDQKANFHVGLIAIDGNGKVAHRAAATTALEPARAGRQSPSLFTTSLLLDPGDYTLRLAVIDDSGRPGSVHQVIHAGYREWPRGVRTSDLIVANQPINEEFPPFNASSIVDTRSVAAVIDVLHDDQKVLDGVFVQFELNGRILQVDGGPASLRAGRYVRTFATLLRPPTEGELQLRAIVLPPGGEPITLERGFSFEPRRP